MLPLRSEIFLTRTPGHYDASARAPGVVLLYWESGCTSVKTTIRIDDELLQKAWKEAQRRGISLASMVEQGLRLALSMPPKIPAERITKLSAFFAPRKAPRNLHENASVPEDQD
jgi:hypothetical protein